mmetsp:Transcript_15324/g.38976  ORF Transcript_15324/g.38976 Transcript_15324/m.38976 type:complete len:672 (+) Transcript_15324:388-2403(+)
MNDDGLSIHPGLEAPRAVDGAVLPAVPGSAVARALVVARPAPIARIFRPPGALARAVRAPEALEALARAVKLALAIVRAGIVRPPVALCRAVQSSKPEKALARAVAALAQARAGERLGARARCRTVEPRPARVALARPVRQADAIARAGAQRPPGALVGTVRTDVARKADAEGCPPQWRDAVTVVVAGITNPPRASIGAPVALVSRVAEALTRTVALTVPGAGHGEIETPRDCHRMVRPGRDLKDVFTHKHGYLFGRGPLRLIPGPEHPKVVVANRVNVAPLIDRKDGPLPAHDGVDVGVEASQRIYPGRQQDPLRHFWNVQPELLVCVVAPGVDLPRIRYNVRGVVPGCYGRHVSREQGLDNRGHLSRLQITVPQLTVVVEPRGVHHPIISQHQCVVGPRCHLHNVGPDEKVDLCRLIPLRKVPESQLPLCVLPPNPQLPLVRQRSDVECAAHHPQYDLVLEELNELRHVPQVPAIGPSNVLLLKVCDAELPPVIGAPRVNIALNREDKGRILCGRDLYDLRVRPIRPMLVLRLDAVHVRRLPPGILPPESRAGPDIARLPADLRRADPAVRFGTNVPLDRGGRARLLLGPRAQLTLGVSPPRVHDPNVGTQVSKYDVVIEPRGHPSDRLERHVCGYHSRLGAPLQVVPQPQLPIVVVSDDVDRVSVSEG